MENEIKYIVKELEAQCKRIDSYSKRLDSLENNHARTDIKLEYLIEKIDELANSINHGFRWATGLAVTTLLGFFIWYVQMIGR